MTSPRQTFEKGALALLMNTRSRQARKSLSLVADMRERFQGWGPCVETGSPDDLPSALQRIRDHRPTLLFISGGDGTLRQTISQLIRTYGDVDLPQIGIIPSGTMNTVAKGIGISKDGKSHLIDFLSKITNGTKLKTKTFAPLRVNEGHGFIFGMGGFSNFIQEYEKHPDPTPSFAFRFLTHTVLSSLVNGKVARRLFKPFDVSLWKDEEVYLLDHHVTNISASTTSHIGFHFRPYIGTEMADPAIGVLIFRSLPRRMFFHLPRFFFGSPVHDSEILQSSCRDLTIRVHTPMKCMLDGDILPETTEFRIGLGPVIRWVLP